MDKNGGSKDELLRQDLENSSISYSSVIEVLLMIKSQLLNLYIC